MSMPYGQPEPSVAAGWYQDPNGAGHRWWDGAQWTEHTQAVSSGYGQPAQGAGQVFAGLADNGGYSHAGAAVGPGFAQSSAFAPSYQAPTYPGYSTPASMGYGFGPLETPKNGLATGALIAGIVVVVAFFFLGFAVVSALAILLGVRALNKARAIKAQGYPTAVGMARAITGLALSTIGAVSWVLTMVAR